LLAAGAALSASRAAAQARLPTHVACVGDSITAGYAASSSAAAYPSVLQTMFGASVQVRNFGHSGATMTTTGDLPYQSQPEYTAATSFVSGAGATSVVDVIIMLGTNDSKSQNWMTGTGTRAQQLVTDCSALVDHFATLPTHPVVYLALPPRAWANSYGISGTIIHDQILPLIRQVAAAKAVPVIDVDTPTASHPELFPDGVHPNDTGYALVAQVMHDGLLTAAGGQGGAGGGGGSGAGGAGGAAVDAGRVDGPPATGGAGGGAMDAGRADAAGPADAGVAGAGGAAFDAGRSDAAAPTDSGSGGAIGGSPGAIGGSTGTDAGVPTSGGSACSCRVPADHRGGSRGAALGLVALALSAACARARRRPARRLRGRQTSARAS
jgi:lysophospholipase L1-like esterase